MAQRILLGGLFHETHSFIAQSTGIAQFQSGIGKWQEGEALVTASRGDASTMGGFIEVADEAGWEIVPTAYYAAAPSGVVEQHIVDRFLELLLGTLAAEYERLDGVYLVLHGAMVSEAWGDVEGEVLKRLQDAMAARGRLLPVCGVLDLHCNYTAAMARHSDCLWSYRENPHTDSRESAINGARVLQRILAENLKPATVYLHPPMLLAPRGTGTAADPMRSVLRRAREMEAANPDLLCINVFGGYAYSDIPETGFSLSATTLGDTAAARSCLHELADIARELRDLGNIPDDPIEGVLATIDPSEPGPIILVEPSDNIGGGTPGDGTGILAALLGGPFPRCVVVIADPESAAACHAAGVGATLDLRVGAKTDAHHGAPVALTAEVLGLSDGAFDLEDAHSHLASMVGLHVKMGPCATVRAQNVTILLTTYKTPPFDLGQLRSQGIEPTEAFIIGVKAAVAHKRAYDGIAKRELYVDTPGLGTSNLLRLPYQHVKRPCFPLDAGI